ncbi:MAG: hypothetical protein OXN97_08550 [Bryobacterales bacterium]|nr:hypothetical protein [Bryobacterales bacterium]
MAPLPPTLLWYSAGRDGDTDPATAYGSSDARRFMQAGVVEMPIMNA